MTTGRTQAGAALCAVLYRSIGALICGSSLAFVGCQGPQSPRTAVEEAEAATAAENWPRAAELWSEVHTSQGGKDRRAFLETARALFRAGDAASACGTLRLGLASFPDDLDLLELSGDIQRECGFRRAAEDCYARVVELDPSRVHSFRALAELRVELGLEHGAVAPLERVIELTGGDAPSYALLGQVLRTEGDTVAAFQAYRRGFDAGPLTVCNLIDAASLCTDAKVRASEPRALEIGAGWLESAVSREPQSTRAHFLLGITNEELGRSEEAALHYRRAVELDPGCIEALTNLAVLYAHMGDAQGTSEMVVRALEIESDPARRAALMHLLGEGLR